MNAITIAELAEKLGVSRMTIHRMRKAGELPPVISTNRRIARWLAADIEFWLDCDCPPTQQFEALKNTRRKFAGRLNRT